MTFVILGEPGDATVGYLAQAWRAQDHDVVVLASSDLYQGSTLSYRIDDHRAAFELWLADGRVLTDQTTRLVVNRLELASMGATSSAHDRYADEEWRAALAGWLRVVGCPVVNPARGTAVGGLTMSPAEWRVAAARVGLPSAPWPSEASVDATMLVVGDAVIAGAGAIENLPDSGAALGAAAIDLARALGVPLIEAGFNLHSGAGFVAATTWPDLSLYGTAAVNELAALAS